jgi:hypothetical protein
MQSNKIMEGLITTHRTVYDVANGKTKQIVKLRTGNYVYRIESTTPNLYFLSIEEALVYVFTLAPSSNPTLTCYIVASEIEFYKGLPSNFIGCSNINYAGSTLLSLYNDKRAALFKTFLVKAKQPLEQANMSSLMICCGKCLTALESYEVKMDAVLQRVYAKIRGISDNSIIMAMDVISNICLSEGYQVFLTEDPPKLKIACLNLGYQVMANNLSGSERPMVEKCQLSYPKYTGWTDSGHTIAVCTMNSAKFLSQYDLFAVQEVNSKYRDTFLQNITNPHRDFAFLASNSILTGYDRKVMGDGQQLTHNMMIESKTDKRPIQAIWFNKLRLLFINLHAPHHIDLKAVIEHACKSINNTLLHDNLKPNRVMIAGDFNDDTGQLITRSINAFGKIIRIPQGSTAPKTCCADSGYKFPGDYILDSQSDGHAYFGLPPGYNRKVTLLSDHDPVVLLDT